MTYQPYTTCAGITQYDGVACRPIDVPGAPAAAAPAAPPPPDPAVVAQIARELLPVQIPGPHTSPDEGGFQLVGLATWLYMNPGDWHPVEATAAIDGVSATVTASPTTMTWDMGDGTAPVRCKGPGNRYQPGGAPQCSHVYIDSAHYSLRVTVDWEVTWTSNTGAAGRQAGLALSTALPLDVRQAQAVTN